MAIRYTVAENVAQQLETISAAIIADSGITLTTSNINALQDNYLPLKSSSGGDLSNSSLSYLGDAHLVFNNTSTYPTIFNLQSNGNTTYVDLLYSRYGTTCASTGNAFIRFGYNSANDNSSIITISPCGEGCAYSTGGTIKLGSVSNSRINFVAGSGASAPSTTSAGTVTNRYGGATNFLGDPTGWIDVQINGTARKIPYY